MKRAAFSDNTSKHFSCPQKVFQSRETEVNIPAAAVSHFREVKSQIWLYSPLQPQVPPITTPEIGKLLLSHCCHFN
jgi:hypothetical protein